VFDLVVLLYRHLGSQARWTKSSHYSGRSDTNRNPSCFTWVIDSRISSDCVGNTVLKVHNSKTKCVREFSCSEVPTHTMRRSVVTICERVISRPEGARIAVPFIGEAIEKTHVRSRVPIQFAQRHRVLKPTGIARGDYSSERCGWG